MSRVTLTSELLTRLRSELLATENEVYRILFGRSVEVDGRLTRIVIRESLIPPAEAYTEQTPTRVQLHPEFVATIAQRARKTGESVAFAHSHPFPLNEFSNTDDTGETVLAEFLEARAPKVHHAALLITPEVAIARELGKNAPLKVIGVGPDIMWGKSDSELEFGQRYDRQIRAFGSHGQAILQSIRVGIVGLGGTGSVVLQQLVHLGVQDFLLIDPDIVEETNLNRLVGATLDNVGQPKALVAKAWATMVNPHAKIDARQESVILASTAHRLSDTDFTFCCTDSHGSRAVLNQLAYQYLLPMIDMGVVISAEDGMISHIVGRIQMLSPPLACLVCANLLDAEQVRRDMLTDFERQADAYIPGYQEPAPATISLNSTVSSLAVSMFLNSVLGIPGKARFINYNAITGATRPVVAAPHASCIVCSTSGALARSDEWPLAARKD